MAISNRVKKLTISFQSLSSHTLPSLNVTPGSAPSQLSFPCPDVMTTALTPHTGFHSSTVTDIKQLGIITLDFGWGERGVEGKGTWGKPSLSHFYSRRAKEPAETINPFPHVCSMLVITLQIPGLVGVSFFRGGGGGGASKQIDNPLMTTQQDKADCLDHPAAAQGQEALTALYTVQKPLSSWAGICF